MLDFIFVLPTFVRACGPIQATAEGARQAFFSFGTQMNREALHGLLVNTLGLVPQPLANAVSCTYFHQKVEWHPARSTRVFRVLFDAGGEPDRIQLCASSDNNNTVLIGRPFSAQALTELAVQEIRRIEARMA